MNADTATSISKAKQSGMADVPSTVRDSSLDTNRGVAK